MSSPEHKQKIWNLIRGIRTGMLTTLHGKELRSRPMYLVQDKYDGTLWFFTDLHAEKVFEVEEDNDVCVAFADPHEDIYVSMTGTGCVTRDKKLIDRFWNPFVADWFPEGKDSENVGLLEIHIDKGEHWNTDTSKMVMFYKMARDRNEMPMLGEHEKFGTSD
ncbi:pyridoxamine 5'-phosphate oxidase family protein [Marinobacter sp.]|uniref:pyridoxamine 5'-phosphate oxidase family protein n=1 Tax=Marinobacter sp. TaxID=50741 RepID=UPI00384ACA8C